MTSGKIRKVLDQEIHSTVYEMTTTNTATTYITCPKDPKKTLGIRLPFLVMILKNLKKNFAFEITIKDQFGLTKRFNVSTYGSKTSISTMNCAMPLCLSDGWNQIHFNMAEFTRRAFNVEYMETCRVQIHGSISIRRIYFSRKLFQNDELPKEFKLFVPICEKNSHYNRNNQLKTKKKKEPKSLKSEKSSAPPPPPPNSPSAKK